MAYASLTPNEIQPLVPALQSNWLISHVVTCFVGYAAFAVSFGVSFLYLFKVKAENRPGRKDGVLTGYLPASEVLDEVGYKTIAIGFPLLTIGIITGAFWANVAWGTYWSWDPKETWSLIVWLIYAAYLHARITKGWRGNKAAVLSIVGFSATLFCYLGVNLITFRAAQLRRRVVRRGPVKPFISTWSRSSEKPADRQRRPSFSSAQRRKRGVFVMGRDLHGGKCEPSHGLYVDRISWRMKTA